jgi:hypothetical protein
MGHFHKLSGACLPRHEGGLSQPVEQFSAATQVVAREDALR